MSTKQGCTNDTTDARPDQTERDLRPRALRYEEHARTIEQMIMDALPRVVTKLVSMAEEGNIAAAKYLIDRIHGRPAKLAAAPTMDTSLRYSHFDWATDQLHQDAANGDRRRIASSMISRCKPPDRRS